MSIDKYLSVDNTNIQLPYKIIEPQGAIPPSGRIIRGEDAIRFLGDHGATFVLPKGKSNNIFPKEWNRPGAGTDVETAIRHHRNGGNVSLLTENLIVLDRDVEFPDTVARLGEYAQTAKIWRTTATDRGALVYRLVAGEQAHNTTWKPAGAGNPHVELLATTRTGNYAAKMAVGHNKGGEYVVVDPQLGIKEITLQDLDAIWRIITGEPLQKPKPDPPAAPRRKHATEVDSDDLLVQVKNAWDCMAVFHHFGWDSNGTETVRSGETRILGHGGLLVNTEKDIWFSHSDDNGGDAIAAWQYCRDRRVDATGAEFWSILEDMARAVGITTPTPRPNLPTISDPPPRPEMPAHVSFNDATVAAHHEWLATPRPDENKIVVLKRITSIPAPTPLPPIPALTPSVVNMLARELMTPAATQLLRKIPKVRNMEMYRDVLIQLVTVIAPEKERWVFSADVRWMGEKLGKSGMSAARNLKNLAAAGLIHYDHTPTPESGPPLTYTDGRPPMRVNLQPLVGALWLNVTNTKNKEEEGFVTLSDDTPNAVHKSYSGQGVHGDASMRTPYTFGIRRTGHPKALMRSLSSSALTVLAYLNTSVGDGFTRKEIAAAAGMTPGSVAGATRILEQMGLVSIEREGRAKIYALCLKWEARLQSLIPDMVSYGARFRLIVRHFDERIAYLEHRLKCIGVSDKLREAIRNRTADPEAAPERSQTLILHWQRLELGRKKWRAYGNKIGAYGRYADVKPPPWLSPNPAPAATAQGGHYGSVD